MADELYQKRAYELDEYVQLVLGDIGYENPSSIWIALDRSGWPQAMKISLVQFLDAVYGQNGTYYLNNGVPWVDQAAVLAGFPYGSRHQFDTVNIAGVEYWFLADRSTLVVKFGSLSLADNSVTNTKLSNTMPSGTILYRKSAGNGNPEYQLLETLRNDLNIPTQSETAQQNVFTVKFPEGTVAVRCANVLSKPALWTVAADSNPIDLLITHGTGREIASIEVWAMETAGKTRLYANMAYSALVAPDNNSIIIKSFATIGFPVTVHLIFE